VSYKSKTDLLEVRGQHADRPHEDPQTHTREQATGGSAGQAPARSEPQTSDPAFSRPDTFSESLHPPM